MPKKPAKGFPTGLFVILVIYLALSTVRFIVSNVILTQWDMVEYYILWVQSIVGIFFILLTATVLFLIIRKKEKTIQETSQALMDSEEKFRTLVASMDDVVTTLDKEQRYTGIYGGTLEKYGFDSKSLLGNTPMEAFSEDNALLRIEANSEALAGRHVVFEWQFPEREKTSYFQTSVSPLKNSEGEIVGVVNISRDITGYKELEFKLTEYRDRLRSLVAESETAADEERRRMAAEVHDRLGQTLAMTKFRIDGLLETVKDPELKNELSEIYNLADQLITDMRALAYELSPPVLHELGFKQAIAWLIDQAMNQTGLKIHFDNDMTKIPLDEGTRLVLFTSVRELIRNIAKHAQAKNAWIEIRQDWKQVLVTVGDDGVGFDPEHPLGSSSNAGFGLFSIRERMTYIGGQFQIESQPGHGAKMTLIAPLAVEKTKDEAVEEDQETANATHIGGDSA